MDAASSGDKRSKWNLLQGVEQSVPAEGHPAASSGTDSRRTSTGWKLLRQNVRRASIVAKATSSFSEAVKPGLSVSPLVMKHTQTFSAILRQATARKETQTAFKKISCIESETLQSFPSATLTSPLAEPAPEPGLEDDIGEEQVNDVEGRGTCLEETTSQRSIIEQEGDDFSERDWSETSEGDHFNAWGQEDTHDALGERVGALEQVRGLVVPFANAQSTGRERFAKRKTPGKKKIGAGGLAHREESLTEQNVTRNSVVGTAGIMTTVMTGLANLNPYDEGEEGEEFNAWGDQCMGRW
eukprot:TRINITY_DN8160_c0_g1_i5.p1 TRINITY_DN8160_c0_g1~~TRINITY_DN8160_c0_g1_i5.p1  ORF type:complete len:298 (-),score=59.55 TRINITY_DN8160_c0_g1_i5:638-1531(-)